jgi:hypothetical protein
MKILSTFARESEGNIFIEGFHFRGLLPMAGSSISRSLDRYLQPWKVTGA